MKRLNTPEPDSHESRLHMPTSIKSKTKGAVEFCDKMSISYFKEDVFCTFNVSHAIGWRALSNQPRRHHNEPTTIEKRGRHSIVTPQKIREMERILEEDGFEARALTWEQLGYEVGLECVRYSVMRCNECNSAMTGWTEASIPPDHVTQHPHLNFLYERPEPSICWLRFEHYTLSSKSSLFLTILLIGSMLCNEVIRPDQWDRWQWSNDLIGTMLPEGNENFGPRFMTIWGLISYISNGFSHLDLADSSNSFFRSIERNRMHWTDYTKYDGRYEFSQMRGMQKRMGQRENGSSSCWMGHSHVREISW